MNLQANNSITLPKKETIRELAKRHLSDPNHTTTDEEIRNAAVVVDGIEITSEIERMFEQKSIAI